MKKYILSIDQGTTSSRAIVFDKNGNIICKSQYEFEQIYPKQAYVEHRVEDIYNTVKRAVIDVLEKVGAHNVGCIGITNQRETTIVWDKTTGEPVYNAIVWQCRRTSQSMDEIKNSKFDSVIFSKTGLQSDAYFSASKIKWILDNVDGAREKAENGRLLFGTVDTYLLWKLTKGKSFATDYTNASRTMLFNIDTKEWDDELCEFFTVPKSMLAPVYPSGYEYGVTDESEIGARIPICSLVGDQQGALFGQNCTTKYSVKNTYGTGCFLLMNTYDERVRSHRGLVTTLGASFGNNRVPYVLEGSVFVGGAVVQWLRDELCLITNSAETQSIAQSVTDSNGVYVVPAFVGLGAPHWDGSARGLICGLTRGANRAHIVRASLESIAYQTFDVLHAMERDLDAKVQSLKVDGGASANDFLMQFQADICDCEVIRPANVESTALGAGMLAGLTAKILDGTEKLFTQSDRTTFEPKMKKQKVEELLLGWNEAVFRAKSK